MHHASMCFGFTRSKNTCAHFGIDFPFVMKWGEGVCGGGVFTFKEVMDKPRMDKHWLSLG